jgi:hypothetical protein
MKRPWLRFIVITILASAAALAQPPGNSSPNAALGPESGTIVSDTYTNEFLGISFPIPAGWQVISDKAVTLEAAGLRGWVLLKIERPGGESYGSRIAASAVDASGLAATTQHFVAIFVNAEKVSQWTGNCFGTCFPLTWQANISFVRITKNPWLDGRCTGPLFARDFADIFLGGRLLPGRRPSWKNL